MGRRPRHPVRRPNFFIVGAPRSGTTALYLQLRQHPEVFMPRRKEPTYFGADLPPRPPALDEDDYLALFRPAGRAAAIGEASVWYLYSESAAAEIRQFAPDARILIMLREPASFVVSLHAHLLFAGQEDVRDLAAAIDAEPARAVGERVPRGAWWPGALQYRRLARYAPYLERYLECFEREQVKVVLHEEMLHEPVGTFADVLTFLGVDPGFRPVTTTVNTSARRARSVRLQRLIGSPRFQAMAGRLGGTAHHVVSRSLIRLNTTAGRPPPVDPTVVERLRVELADGIPPVEALLGRELRAWAHSEQVSE